MKVLTKKELDSLKLVPSHGSKGNPNPITQAIRQDSFKVGDSLLVNKEDYKLKTKFGTYIQQHFRATRSDRKFSIRLLADLSGWVVTRIQ